MIQVDCPNCKRTEAWNVDSDGLPSFTKVMSPGGARRSLDHQDVIRWNAYKSAKERSRGLIAECSCCPGLLVGDTDSLIEQLTFKTLNGELEANGALSINGALLTVDQAEALIVKAHPRPRNLDVGNDVFRLVVFTLFLLPVAMWVFAITYVGGFVVGGLQTYSPF